MRKYKLLFGGIGVLLGVVLITLMIDWISKPSNHPLTFDIGESMSTYFFGFVFALGNVGWFLGGLLLFVILAIFYFIGIGVYRILFRN